MDGVEKTARDGGIGIDPSVAQKRPVAPRLFEQSEIDLAQQDFFAIMRGFGYDAAEGIGQKTSAPEFKTRSFGAVGTTISIIITEFFVTIGLNWELYKNKLLEFIKPGPI